VAVVHVCKEMAASGNRVQTQVSYWDDSSVVVLPPRAFLAAELRKLITSTRKQVFVFHQQSTLPALLIAYFLSLLMLRSHGFVYDMHDLAEASRWSSAREKRFVRVYKIIEYLVARLNIPVITVSQGLCRVFRDRYGRTPKVVYNIGLSAPVKECSVPSRDVVYFGQIKEERLSLSDIEILSRTGMRVDLYGVLPNITESTWADRLLAIVRASGGSFHGRYSPDDMDFLSPYRFSLIAFEAERENIYFCMPNKLFQSLSKGLVCVVSDNMKEMIETFSSTGAVVPMSRFQDKSFNPEAVDWPAARRVLQKMTAESRRNFIEAVSAVSRF